MKIGDPVRVVGTNRARMGKVGIVVDMPPGEYAMVRFGVMVAAILKAGLEVVKVEASDGKG